MSGARQGKPKTRAAVEESATRKSSNRQSNNSQEPIEARRRSATGRSTDSRIAVTTTSSSKRPTLNAIRSTSSQSPPALVAPRSHSSADISTESDTSHALRGLQGQACYPEDTTIKSTRRVHASRGTPLEAAPATILRQPRGPTQSQSGMRTSHQPPSLSPLARSFVNRASNAPSDGHAATLSSNPAPLPVNPPSTPPRTSLPILPTLHAASDASPAPSVPSAAPAASIEATMNNYTPNIAGSHHHPSSSPALPAQTPAAVDLPAWPLPLATDPLHHGVYIAMLSLAEKLGAPVNHQLLALALVPTLALYPGSVLRSDDGVSPAPAGAAPSTTVSTPAMPSRPPTTFPVADHPAPSAAMAAIPSPAVSVPPPASYVPSSAISAPPPASSVPPPASSAPQAATSSTPISGQRVQATLNSHATTTSATSSTTVPSKDNWTTISQRNDTPTTPSIDEPVDVANATIDDTSAAPQPRKRTRAGKKVWARVEKAKIRDALRAAEARHVEQMKANAAAREI